MGEGDVDSRLRGNDEKGMTKKSKAPRWLACARSDGGRPFVGGGCRHRFSAA